MSLLTDIVKSALNSDASGQTESQTQSLLSGALGMLESMGGVNGILKKFQQSGMGDLAASWVGNGSNQSIDADQLTEVLGEEKISEIAQQAGIPESEGASVLSKIFPDLIDKLTPDGFAPDAETMATIGKVLLGGVGVAVAAKAAASYLGKKEEAEAGPVIEAQSTPAAIPSSETEAPDTSTSSARTYTVVSGDTLSKIAKHFYHDGNQWHRIYDANRDILNNPDRIFPGQTLRIP